MGLRAFPKIFAIGQDYIRDLFNEPVEITEKVDGCFDYESLVILADGSKEKIGKIVNNRMLLDVLSFNEETGLVEVCSINGWHKNGTTKDWMKISVKGYHGQSYALRCTPNHHIKIDGRGWVKADDISVGERVLHRELAGNPVEPREILSIESFTPHNKTKYDISVEGNHNYLVNNILVHNSQFNFGRLDGELCMRSKGKEIFIEFPEKMFDKAIDYILSIEDRIPDNTVFHAEYLRASRHNVLAYERVPENNLVLFGVSDTSMKFVSVHDELKDYARLLEIDVAPMLYYGMVESIEQLVELLETDSFLGGNKVEGVVCKNYARPFLLGGQPIPLMMGKFVSEKYKEKHEKDWNRENKSKGRWEVFCEQYRSEARWQKAVQHLADKGELESAPRDIGRLLKEVHLDIEGECKDEILAFLWKEFGGDLKRKAVAGLPEWYKELLATKSFGERVGRDE